MAKDNSDAGLLVWRDLTQAALDAAYDQTAYATNREQVLKRYAINSERCRHRLGPPQRFAYGVGEKESIDVYRGPSPKAPINIFIYGGAWRAGSAADYGFPAELFVRAGANFAVPDFDWVQDRDGDLTPIADQVRRAIAWTWHNANQFGGDPDRLFLSAHSSGAHLAGVALTTDWEAEFGLPNDAIKGALLCSGIYDLEPVRLSARSSYVTFTDESEAALSPIRHIARINCPIILAYGTLETPEFQRQSQDFATALAAHGHDCTHLVGDALNHFEILETLAMPDGLLGRAVLEKMRLAET
jgi:arylformamidase